MENLSWIKSARKKLGITQQRLSKLAGVSQSLVAKVEAGKLDPSYSKAQKMVDALSREGSGQEKTARDIMHSEVASVSSGSTLHEAAAIMRKKAISQLPVVEDGKVIGSINEQAVLRQFSENPKGIAGIKVAEAVEDSFPTTLPSTPISAIAALLRHYPAVLVMARGEVAGIITKADLLKAI
jgi:predicted transcriptional regulator